MYGPDGIHGFFPHPDSVLNKLIFQYFLFINIYFYFKYSIFFHSESNVGLCCIFLNHGEGYRTIGCSELESNAAKYE